MAQQQDTSSNDGWQSLPVGCEDGLILNMDALTQGTMKPGSARILQNYEVALEGGYRRISGYIKFDANTVPGDANSPILGVKAALGGVFAARKVVATPTTDIYFSSGSGWGSRINSSNRGGSPSRVRMITYALGSPRIAGVDGVNPAFKYDGTTYTLINGMGAPSNPAYIELFNTSIALSGYTSGAGTSGVILTTPGSDINCNAADGALEINVGNVVTGLKVFRNTLYIFCNNAIYKLSGTDATTWALEPVTTQIGCVAGDTIQEIGGDLIYLAPDGFRSVAGTFNIGDVDLSLQSRAIQPFIKPILADIAGHVFASCVVRKKSQYRCIFHDPTITRASTTGVIGKVEQGTPTEAFNYIYTKYAWSTTLGLQCHCMDSYFDSGIERVVMGDHITGYVYSLESGTDFDGTAINAIYQSPYITFKDATFRKVMQKIDTYTSFEGSNDINLGLNFDFNNVGIMQPTPILLQNTGAYPVYGTALYGTAVYSGTQFPVFKNNVIGSGFTTAFSYTSTGGAPYTISSYQITYSLKGRR